MKNKIILIILMTSIFLATGCSIIGNQQNNSENSSVIKINYVNNKIPNEVLDYPTYFASNIDSILGKDNWKITKKQQKKAHYGSCDEQLKLTVDPLANDLYTTWTISYKLPSGKEVTTTMTNSSMVLYICNGEEDSYLKTTVEDDVLAELLSFGNSIALEKLYADMKTIYDWNSIDNNWIGYDYISLSLMNSPLISEEEAVEYRNTTLKADWFNINDITMNKLLSQEKSVLFVHLLTSLKNEPTVSQKEEFQKISDAIKNYLITNYGTFSFEGEISNYIGNKLYLNTSADYYNGEVTTENLFTKLNNKTKK